MQGKGKKKCKFPPKFTKIIQNCAKTSLFSAIKHLFCFLKKRSKSTFQPMKVCSKWVCLEGSWVDSEFFNHFYEGDQQHMYTTTGWCSITYHRCGSNGCMWGRGSGGALLFLVWMHSTCTTYGIRRRRWPLHAHTIGGRKRHWGTPVGRGGEGRGAKGPLFGRAREKKTPTNPVFIFIDIKLVSTCCTGPFGLPGLAPNELKYKTKSRKPEKKLKKFKIQKIERILKKKSRTSKKNQNFFLKKGFKKVFF